MTDEKFLQGIVTILKEIRDSLKNIDEKLKELEQIRASINLRFGRK